MSCLHPTVAYYDARLNPPKVLFKPREEWLVFGRLPDGVSTIALPCGKCFGCVKSRALDITVRAVAESRVHDVSSFVTLTVNEDYVNEIFPHGLEHRPFQLFAKRLRKKIGKFSYLMCGEYGPQTLRPHYHCIIFGHYFVDSNFETQSKILRDAWSYGNISIDLINTNRIAYVAGYTCKDFAIGRTKDFYKSRGLGLPYVKWSRRPSLGLRYLQKYWSDLLDDDFNLSFVLDGKEFKFGCRYFVQKLQLISPENFAKLKAAQRDRFLDEDFITAIMRHSDNQRRLQVQKYNLARKRENAIL